MSSCVPALDGDVRRVAGWPKRSGPRTLPFTASKTPRCSGVNAGARVYFSLRGMRGPQMSGMAPVGDRRPMRRDFVSPAAILMTAGEPHADAQGFPCDGVPNSANGRHAPTRRAQLRGDVPGPARSGRSILRGRQGFASARAERPASALEATEPYTKLGPGRERDRQSHDTVRFGPQPLLGTQ